MILNRIGSKFDKRLGRQQQRTYCALRRLIEGVKSSNLKGILVFIDFKKPLTVYTDCAYDIPETLIDAIGLLYQEAKARVITFVGETDTGRGFAGGYLGTIHLCYRAGPSCSKRWITLFIG